jgi:phage-related tail protein
MKGEIDSAHKSLVNYRHSIEIVKKTRKTYRNSCNDVGEIQQDIQRIKDDTSKTKDIERLEGKLKKAHGQMEHAKSEHEKSINAYHKQWSDFEEKMTEACKKFQSFDEEHVGNVRKIVIKITTCHETCERELYHDFTKLKDKMEMFPVKKLMEIFIQLKGTGTTKPELLQFSPIKVQSLKLPISSGGNVTTPPASDVSNTSVAGEEIAVLSLF